MAHAPMAERLGTGLQSQVHRFESGWALVPSEGEMLPATKIVNEQEVIRWIREGKTYRWMTEEYKRKYDIDVVIGVFVNFRRTRGLERRNIRDDNLLPWLVQERHRYLYGAQMLRCVARMRAGYPVPARQARRVNNLITRLKREGLVIDYRPDTVKGWFYVPARPIDTDIIRVPDAKTTPRRNADR